MKQEGIRRATNYKRLSVLPNKLRVAGRWGGRERVIGLWTLENLCDMVFDVKCVSLTIHRPLAQEQRIHYVLIKIINEKGGRRESKGRRGIGKDS